MIDSPTSRAASEIAEIARRLETLGYICNASVATSLFLAERLEKPLMIEGPPGVGKTELAKTTALMLGKPLIRLQCYEGLDEAKSLYEWKYGKQLLYTQVLKDKLGDLLQGAEGLKESMRRLHEFDDTFFSEEFLEPRPLLKALSAERGAVLLIDEIDKADDEFEAFLLEILSDYQISIPEIGTISARVKPLVFSTSNGSRELSDALKRRCLHLFIPFPDAALERAIVAARAPQVAAGLRAQLVAFVQGLRKMDLKKAPAVSETIDWARALVLLNARDLEAELVSATLNVLLKYQEDIARVAPEIPAMTRAAEREAERDARA